MDRDAEAGAPDRGEVGLQQRKSARNRWLRVIAAAIVGVAVVGLIIWGVASSTRTSGSARPSADSPRSAATSPTATPSASSDSAQPTTVPAEGDSAVRPTNAPVDIADEASPVEGLSARLVTIESVQGEAVIPGEVGGPAIRVTLEVVNDTGQTLETPAVVVNLYVGEDLAPAGPILNPGGKPFPSSVPAGATASGVYLFTVPEDRRGDIAVEVDLAVGTPIVVFKGAVR